MMIPSYHGSQLHGMIPQHTQYPQLHPTAYPFSNAPLPFLPPSNFISLPHPQASGAHSQQSRPQGLPTSSSAQALADNSFLSNLQAIKTSMPGKKKHSISFVDPAMQPSNTVAAPAAPTAGPSHPAAPSHPQSISNTNAPAATVTNVRTNEAAIATTALSPLSLLFASTPTGAETAALAECLAYSSMPNTARAVVKEEGAGIFPPIPNEGGSSPFPLDLLRPHHRQDFQPPQAPSCSTAVRASEQVQANPVSTFPRISDPAISACAAPAPLTSGSRSSDQNLPQASVEVSFVDPPFLAAAAAGPALSNQPLHSAEEEDLNCMESLDVALVTPPFKRPLSQEDFEAPSLPFKKKVKAAGTGEVLTMGESEGGSKKKKERQEDGATNENIIR